MLSATAADDGAAHPEVLVAEGEGPRIDPKTGLYLPTLAASTGFLPSGYSARDYLPVNFTPGVATGNNTPGLPKMPFNALVVQEAEPNDTLNQGNIVGIGTGPGQDPAAQISGTISTVADLDYYRFQLRAGDIISALVTGGANDISLFDSQGIELQGSQVDPQGPAIGPVYPNNSPLLTGGNAAIAYVIPADGQYSLFASGNFNPQPNGPPIGGGPYTLDVQVFRPVLESQPVGTKQILYIDFDGAVLPRNIFDPTIQGNARLSPLDNFLPGWGLDPLIHKNAVIDSILATIQKQIKTDIQTLGNNGSFANTGIAGQFDIEIRNSRDHADPWGLPNVSRVVVGGTTAELRIQTIGIAESIDVGNFNTQESAVVLLDLLSTGTGANSLNGIPRHPATTIIDVIGRAVGTIVTHEAGHFFAAWHQNNTNTNPQIMDTGGNFANTLGLGLDGIFGTADDIDVRFGRDYYSPTEFFTGTEDTLNAIAFGLSTGRVGSTVSGIKYADVNGNGIRDTNEGGLAGFTIYADLNANSVLDPGEPRSVTSANGSYSLTVPPGTVRIAEIQQAGFLQTFPAAPGFHTITVAAGQNVTGINFGNQAIVPQAKGVKWSDTNGNGVRDAGEPGIAGVWIYIDLDQDGKIDAGEPATVTDAFGNYSLSMPGPGTFQIREVLEPGFVQTFPGGNGAHTVTVTGTQQILGRDFGNQPAMDYGDAPVDYPVTLAKDGARHGVLQGFSLGSAIDGENNGQPSNNALGDDNNGRDDGTGTGTIIDDEDGVTFSGPLFAGLTNQITVSVQTGAFAPGMLQAWFDWNRDGDWDDAGEQVVKNLTLRTGTHVIDIPVPATALVGNTFARFRYSHAAGLGVRGSAPTGEVEDYQVLVLENRPNANNDTFNVLQDSVANSLDVLANDFASTTGVLTITTAGSNGQSQQLGVVTVSPDRQRVFYSPRPGFFGVDTFSYTITDGAGRFDTATVTVNVLPNFDNPVAVDDSFNVAEGSANNRFSVLTNDIAGRNGPINIVSFGPTLNGGTVTIVSSGQAIQYTPPASFNGGNPGGTDQFTYTIADSANPPNLSTAKVTVHVLPGDAADNLVDFILRPTDLNGVPFGTGAAVRVGDQFKIQVLVDDLRPDLQALGAESAYMDLLYDALKVQIVDIQFGSLYPNARNRDTSVPGIVNEVGAFAGTADPGPAAVELFTLTVQAVSPGTAEFKSDPSDILPLRETILRRNTRIDFPQIGYGTASVNILGDIAGGPKAVDDSRTTSQGIQNFSIDVLANDSAGTGTVKELLSVGTSSNATITINNNGTPNNLADDRITYTPNANFSGTDQFIYTMGNGTGLTSTATVTVHVFGATNNRVVDFILEAVDPVTGQVVNQVQGGKTFILNTYVQDKRAFPPREIGVFSAFMDLLYDSNLATVVASGTNPRGFAINFGVAYPNSQSGTAVVPGFIDEVGAVSDNNPIAQTQSRVLLDSIQFTASTTATGQLIFRTDPADIPLTHDTLLFDSDVPALTVSQITFGTLTINVVTGGTASAFTNVNNVFDVNADGAVSPLDALHVINDLNRNGSRTLTLSSLGAEGESPAARLLYLDVNGDGQLSPIDALSIINRLNQVGSGEGESRGLVAEGNTQFAVATPFHDDLTPAEATFAPVLAAPADDVISQAISAPISATLGRTESRNPADTLRSESSLDAFVSSSVAEPTNTSDATASVADHCLANDDLLDSALNDDLAADVFAAWDHENTDDEVFGDIRR